MIHRPWRTVVLNTYENLSLKDNNLLITMEEGAQKIPLDQVREIMIISGRGNIAVPLITSLAYHNISVIFCDSRHSPVCELNGFGNHYERAGKQMDQASWTKRRKEAVWKQIVKSKISQQISLLENEGLDIPDNIRECLKSVEADDITNREAIATKIYFNLLYGKDFRRFASDDINSALNYGYTIIRSSFDRAIAMHGYRSEIGIHHHNRQNPYNLSCDLMEPFRPFVDEFVYNNIDRVFDWEYRKELISLPYNSCIYEGNETDIATTIERFTYDVMETMLVPRKVIGEVRFCQ